MIVSRDWLIMMDGSGGDELIEGVPTREVRRYSQSGQGKWLSSLEERPFMVRRRLSIAVIASAVGPWKRTVRVVL